MASEHRIRAARADDGPALQEIERRAGVQFREVGMANIAEATPEPLATLTEFADAGRSFVATGNDDEPIGYVIVETVDGNAHVEQISVLPDRQGTGVGRALMDRVRAWAAEHHLPAITLTTFTDVPWNRPLYAHLGFSVIADEHLGPELRAVRVHEATLGLDPELRVCMRSAVHQ